MIDRRRSKWTPMLAVAMIPLVVGYRHSRGERTFRRIQSLDEIAPNVFAPTPSKVVPEKKVGPQKLGPNPLGDSLDALEAELENSTDVLDSPALSPTVESVESSPVSSPSSSGTGGNIYSLPTIPTVSIVQSLENLRSSSSGKAGKASKSKSLKGCKKATKSKVSKAPHPSKAPSPSQAPNPSKAPSSGKGKGGSSKHAHHLRPECEDDGSGSLEYSTDHCNSIQTASASTDGPSATFQIDFVLIIRGDVASVLSSLQSFFQQVIAPFMAGCNSEGLVPGTISNVVFTVTEDTTESKSYSMSVGRDSSLNACFLTRLVRRLLFKHSRYNLQQR